MKLSLRSARKLESKINKHLEETLVDSSVKVRVNADTGKIIDSIASERTKVLQEMEDQLKLLTIKYQLRELISRQNSSSGIDTWITDKVLKEQMISKLKTWETVEVQVDQESLSDLLELSKKKLANPGTDSYRGRNESITTSLSVLMKVDVDTIKKKRLSLVKEIEAIEETIMGLNHSEKIEISEDSIKLLQKLSLL
jgi:hypothetical protein